MFDQQARQPIERILCGINDPSLVASLAEALLVVIYNGENRRVEARITSSDGQVKDIDMALIPVPTADNHRSGIVMSARDITQFKELERFKARFIADAVHDLSTPITALSTRIYLLRQFPEKLNEHVSSLENQVNHLRDLLADLRMLSLLDRGQISLNLERANVNDLVWRVLDTYEPVATGKQQTISFDAEPDMPTAYFDRRQCERVISNLVSNAINYTPPGKTIHILTAVEEHTVLIEITDQGIGIGLDDLGHIFERFYRSAQARDIQSTGTGLGLAIVKEIVELHGGSVSVTSELGTGSTFTVRFPCR
jgi:two-component system phosphate regulon sensor histidine kinase PhoR